MSKNILIFSDGTGQAGGLLVDENRSNVYKLHRGTRVGPDSMIDETLLRSDFRNPSTVLKVYYQMTEYAPRFR